MTTAASEEPRETLRALEDHDEFIMRHIGPRQHEIEHMLEVVGAASLDALVESTLPAGILDNSPLALSESLSETDALRRLKAMADKNQIRHNMIGQGYSETITPAVILRNLFENPGWYTAYTPYQAEIAQGRLEAILNFQQMVADLTGMEMANASLLDEATAAAEAMAQLKRINRKNKSQRFIVDQACFAQTRDVLKTRARYFGFELAVGDPAEELARGESFGLLLQYPVADGDVRDIEAVIAAAHQAGTLVAVATDLMSLVLLKPPGEMGADVVLGNSQRFGVPMGYGGPHAAFYATHAANARTMPGRVIGVSKDRHGRPALRMALQTREQHIRRDKATSNICTSQALLAGMAGMYAVYHGPERLRKIAQRIHRQACLLAAGLRQLDVALLHTHFFDTLSIQLPPERADEIIRAADAAGINLFRAAPGVVNISIGESTSRLHLQALLEACADGTAAPNVDTLDRELGGQTYSIPEELIRQSAFLQHPVFNNYHSETEMLRYLKRLENRDLSLAHAMIPLGSCTMKLNATSEMLPVTWPGFGAMHPFAPLDQATGYLEMVTDLEQMLQACTGYDAVSLQPNAGSQGEYGGLLTIRAYHEANGEEHRNVCLIPSSAHGTNPASAAMAGMKVVVVGCDEHGNVDVDDLTAKAQQHAPVLAALMITYPSTHGVYEEQVQLICETVHRHGGQVYLDGANLNALVGFAGPGKFGADVSHLNLHKTFCIPHGGGGPGVGPLCVREHLAPYLPGHSVVDIPAANAANGAISAAPWGSASILPISWAYIAMMGPEGMKRATAVAILGANYIARRLQGAFKVLYTGRGDRVAHECIIDLRPFKATCGITEEDVAKRLIDYGFHAPTMSFPVPGTLMIEPTESESLAELDRFCEAMLAIRDEIRAVESGRWPVDDNPLVNAPHTTRDLMSDWQHSYSPTTAIYPVDNLWERKFWPYVSRVDNVYGDRNLFCSCLPMEAWVDDAEAVAG